MHQHLEPGTKEAFNGKTDVITKPLMVVQEVGLSVGYGLIEFFAHIVHIAANGQFYVILLPVEGRMDIDVPLLMQETIGGLYAVLRNHWS